MVYIKVQLHKKISNHEAFGTFSDGPNLRPVQRGTQFDPCIIIKLHNEARRLTRLSNAEVFVSASGGARSVGDTHDESHLRASTASTVPRRDPALPQFV